VADSWSRREWLSAALAAPMGALIPRLMLDAGPTILIHVDPLADRDARDGVTFGLSEANYTASLIGGRVTSTSTPMPTSAGLAGVIADRAPVSAFPATMPVVSLSRGAAPAGKRFFYMSPSPEQRAAALDSWRRAHSDARGVLSVDEWHPRLVRFGAGEVNERYARMFGRPMTPIAWCGWSAVKALSECAFQSGGSSAASIEALQQLRFDAHKGVALSFDPETRRLRQPLYVVRTGADSGVIGEIA
jgi:hypothetical protein